MYFLGVTSLAPVCRGCQGRLFYDGSEDAVFNFTPEHKFTYELCFGFFNDVLHQPLTFNAYYLSLRDAFALAGQLGDMCSRNTIRSVRRIRMICCGILFCWH